MEDHEVAVEMKCVSELQSELGRRTGYVPGIMGTLDLQQEATCPETGTYLAVLPFSGLCRIFIGRT